MSKIFFIMLMAALLSACGTNPPQTVVSYKYVTWSVPTDMTSIPPYTYIDISKATQKDVSDWIISNEKRTESLELKLKKIRKLSDDKNTEVQNGVTK